jgi:hypothetical protein
MTASLSDHAIHLMKESKNDIDQLTVDSKVLATWCQLESWKTPTGRLLAFLWVGYASRASSPSGRQHSDLHSGTQKVFPMCMLSLPKRDKHHA